MPRSDVAYAELHCHSNFSFGDGASHPEELVEEGSRLGLCAMAITDHDGFYGVVRFAQAAAASCMPTVFGAELTLDLKPGIPRNSEPRADPEGVHLVVLARDPHGYARLSRAISAAQMSGGRKGRPTFDLDGLSRIHGGHWLVLTGCRKGAVPAALADHGPSAATRQLDRLIDCFGRPNVAVELWDHGDPLDSVRNDGMAALAARAGVDVVATNNVHYATPAQRPLATAIAAVRARRPLEEIDGWLPAGAGAHLRSGAEQARRFARYPGVVERAAELANACAFDLALVAPNLPDYPVPEGHTQMSWLRVLTLRGAGRRYGPSPAEGGDAGASTPWALPATSSSSGTSFSSAGTRTSTARDGDQPPTAPFATHWESPMPTPWPWVCSSSASCRPSATGLPTSTSTSNTTAEKRSFSTSTATTDACTPRK